MRRLVGSTLLTLTLSISGCGGGGGGGSASGTAEPPSEQPGGEPGGLEPPTPQPALFDCSSSAPAPTSDVDTPLAGVWEGTLVDCSSQTIHTVYAYVTDTGRLHLPWFSDGGGLLTGVIKADGDTFAGDGRHFDPSGGWSAGLQLSGLVREGNPIVISDDWIVERARMEGLWSSESGHYGYFALDYGAGQNHPPIPLGGWPAEWDLWGASSILPFQPTAWTIESGGAVTGEDAGGCTYSGQFAATDPQFFYDLDLTISGCPLEGTYSGIGHPHSGPFNDILEVSLDDGDQHAVLLYFGSK